MESIKKSIDVQEVTTNETPVQRSRSITKKTSQRNEKMMNGKEKSQKKWMSRYNHYMDQCYDDDDEKMEDLEDGSIHDTDEAKEKRVL